MTREPDPFAECRPGGSCPDCNAPADEEESNASPDYDCALCEEPGAAKFGGLCEECEENERIHESPFDTMEEARGER